LLPRVDHVALYRFDHSSSTTPVRPRCLPLPLCVTGRWYQFRPVGRLASVGGYVIKMRKRLGQIRRLHSLLTCSETCQVIVSVMVDIKFFRASTVTYASISGRRGLADRAFTRELSEASCTSEGAEALATGALSLRVCARVASLTTIATALFPQTAPI